jgi:endonuclease/exonuclease/phosphatase family metal-dependent hydrolase
VLASLWLLAALTPAFAQAPPAPAAAPLKVMSFNIRLGTAADGDDHWTKRREMLFDLLKEQDADLVGLQEAFRFQVDEILAAVPIYAVAGVGRDDGRAAGEMSCILFRRDRFAVAESGTFWFSDSPAIPGSRTWGNRITRISSWARFVERDGTSFYHYNLHLDHQSQPSREKSTELLLARIVTRGVATEPVIVTGDFNSGEANPALHRLTGDPGVTTTVPAAFVDTFRVLHPDETVVGTFTGFKLGQVNGDKIDYVLVQPGTAVLDAAIVRTSRDGHYPSDHFPVTATIRLPEPAVPPAAVPGAAPQPAGVPVAPLPDRPRPPSPPPPVR